MLRESLIYLPGIIGTFAIASFVAARSRQLSFRLYTLFSISLGGWLIMEYLADAQIGNAQLWLECASAIAFIFADLFLLFVYAYFRQRVFSRKWIVGLAILTVGLAPLSFTRLVVDHAAKSPNGVIFQAGPFFTMQTLVVVGIMVAGLANLLLQLRHASALRRSQVYLLLLAFTGGLVGNVFAGFIFATNRYWQIARPISIFLMLSVIAYAMVYRKLFDIRGYAVRAVTYALTIVLVGGLYVGAAVLPAIHFLHAPLHQGTIVYLSVLTLVVAFFFHPLRTYFNRLTSRIFLRDYYDPQETLDRLGDMLVRTVDTQEIEDKSQALIEATLRPTFMRYLLLARHTDEASLLHHLIQSGSDIILTDEIDNERFRLLQDTLRKKDVALAVRLRTSHEDLGFLIFGYRRSGAPYTGVDRRFVSVVADEVAIGLQNALRFQEIERFNVTLQERIEEATRKLRRTNEKLKTLDQTKDDFISMASHQLRTPLTSVKGYVSMVLDGDAGKITPLQRKLLNQSFVSAQRMVYLISDLLNVSRLRTGKFVIEAIPTNLATVIKDEIEQLVETAAGRNVQLIYHKPEHFPTLMLDETKIRQVIMNFIDNAIYYTQSGGHITVNLTETPKSIEFTVVDDGIGVPKHEQPHLFSKFYRAANAKRARPDGTGLGLFMAKKVIIAQGGAIIFKSQESKGSTFGFSFAKAKLPPTSTSAVKNVA
jgi:signal transduction histidine kinase